MHFNSFTVILPFHFIDSIDSIKVRSRPALRKSRLPLGPLLSYERSLKCNWTG